MTARLIEREFVYQGAYEQFTPRTDPRWGTFQNNFAVWNSSQSIREEITLRRQISLPQGNYYVTGTADNSGSVIINGGRPINLYQFNAAVDRGSVGNSTVINHSGGIMNIVINAYNAGDVAGVAVTISEYKQDRIALSAAEQYKYGTGDNYRNVGSPYVGALVWSTRTPLPTPVGRNQIVMPFSATITAHVWGAGGGGGGMDAASQGGLGAPGLYNTRTFNVSRGDILEVFVGEGGNGGASSSRSAPGGSAGLSRININGDATKSLNGGTGGTAGGSGSSGGGGGGGGASGVLVNNVPVIVAGGGGGGGGAGVADRNNAGVFAKIDAVITNNAIGASGTDYRGENGQPKSGDGGGGGAGGGGYPGGQGGSTPGGDVSAFAGQCGGNFPIFSATAGTNSPYYKSGFSGGGARGGGTGQNGRVYLLIQPLGIPSSIKIGGQWKQVNKAYVKISGNWKEISNAFIKVDNNWKQVTASGQLDLAFTPETTNYGTVDRGYS